MPSTIRRALFKRQLLEIAADYRECAGSDIATKFVNQIEDAIHARHRITGHETVLETASIDVADGRNVIDRIRRLLLIPDT